MTGSRAAEGEGGTGARPEARHARAMSPDQPAHAGAAAARQNHVSPGVSGPPVRRLAKFQPGIQPGRNRAPFGDRNNNQPRPVRGRIAFVSQAQPCLLRAQPGLPWPQNSGATGSRHGARGALPPGSAACQTGTQPRFGRWRAGRPHDGRNPAQQRAQRGKAGRDADATGRATGRPGGTGQALQGRPVARPTGAPDWIARLSIACTTKSQAGTRQRLPGHTTMFFAEAQPQDRAVHSSRPHDGCNDVQQAAHRAGQPGATGCPRSGHIQDQRRAQLNNQSIAGSRPHDGCNPVQQPSQRKEQDGAWVHAPAGLRRRDAFSTGANG
jgi:hypothetical protein